MPLGELVLAFGESPAAPSDYRRSLDLTRAVARTEYSLGGDRFRRDYFASAADGVLVVRLTADRPSRINLTATIETLHRYQNASVLNEAELLLTAKAPIDAEPLYHGGKITYASDADGGGLNFAARLRVVATGGAVRAHGGGLHIDKSRRGLIDSLRRHQLQRARPRRSHRGEPGRCGH